MYREENPSGSPKWCKERNCEWYLFWGRHPWELPFSFFSLALFFSKSTPHYVLAHFTVTQQQGATSLCGLPCLISMADTEGENGWDFSDLSVTFWAVIKLLHSHDSSMAIFFLGGGDYGRRLRIWWKKWGPYIEKHTNVCVCKQFNLHLVCGPPEACPWTPG